MRVLSLAASAVRSMWPSSRKARTAVAIMLVVVVVVALTAYGQTCCGLLLSGLEQAYDATRALFAMVIQWLKSGGVVEQIADTGVIYIGSATILSFASFGSVLTIRVYMSPKKPKMQASGLLLVLGSVIMIIIIHTHIMVGVCCIGLPKTALVVGLFAASAFLMLVVLGYSMMVDAQIQVDKRKAFWRSIIPGGRAAGNR